jgi:hypothetical protein
MCNFLHIENTPKKYSKWRGGTLSSELPAELQTRKQLQQAANVPAALQGVGTTVLISADTALSTWDPLSEVTT